jgi:hypothetical protein
MKQRANSRAPGRAHEHCLLIRHIVTSLHHCAMQDVRLTRLGRGGCCHVTTRHGQLRQKLQPTPSRRAHAASCTRNEMQLSSRRWGDGLHSGDRKVVKIYPVVTSLLLGS